MVDTTHSGLTSVDRVALVGLVVAIYGGILSTINSVVQVVAYRKDRADVVLKVRSNMMTTSDRRYEGMKLTLVTATNRGKRPVTIEGFSTKLLDSRTEFLLMDIRPPIPCEITEGKSVTAYVNEASANREYVECYYVWDSVGRYFRARMVPWPRSLWSRFRRKYFPVLREKSCD
jgi:hypothetical protein